MLRAITLTVLSAVLWLPAHAQDSAGVELPVRPAPSVGFAEGQFIPDVELPLIDGSGTLRLSDYQAKDDQPGKPLLLIHFASW